MIKMYEGQNMIDKNHVKRYVVLPKKWDKKITKIAKMNIRGMSTKSGHIRQAIKYYIMELTGKRPRGNDVG